MATILARGNEIGYTILPYTLKTPIQQELFAHPSDYVLGYVTFNPETGKRKFTYTESGSLTEATEHWSLAIFKETPYCEQYGPWIVYNCSPQKTRMEFNKIINKYGHSLYIHSWDTWSVAAKKTNVTVITSWEKY